MQIDILAILHISSFFNFWYWLFVAVSWSRMTYFILNVPLHDARYADRNEGKFMEEFEQLMRISVDRHTELFDQLGVVLSAFSAFILATIITLGFGFGFELMQAFSFLMVGATIASLHSVAFAYRLRANPLSGTELVKSFYRHRRVKQVLGMFFIAITSIYAVIREVMFAAF